MALGIASLIALRTAEPRSEKQTKFDWLRNMSKEGIFLERPIIAMKAGAHSEECTILAAGTTT